MLENFLSNTWESVVVGVVVEVVEGVVVVVAAVDLLRKSEYHLKLVPRWRTFLCASFEQTATALSAAATSSLNSNRVM